jgi:hypothetical protein
VGRVAARDAAVSAHGPHTPPLRGAISMHIEYEAAAMAPWALPQLVCKRRLRCCHAVRALAWAVRAELSSMAYEGPAWTMRFFCRFSSRLFLRSSMMLSSRLRRASSASTPFLNSFLRGTPAAGFMVASDGSLNVTTVHRDGPGSTSSALRQAKRWRSRMIAGVLACQGARCRIDGT